jgi:choline dehydrogenase-like flavoprotein
MQLHKGVLNTDRRKNIRIAIAKWRKLRSTLGIHNSHFEELDMPFDFVIVGAGSAGAVIAARLSEDPNCNVCLVEAGGHPPAHELMPAVTGTLQNDPETDWMFSADPGNAGLGLLDRRMMVPRGKMLGGSSGINYMAYVRGHPGDFNAWAESGARGWSYDDVLPYFRKSEDLAPSNEISIDGDAHGQGGPLGVSVRGPTLRSARGFVSACETAGIPRGDYNGRDRENPAGVSSLFQTTTRNGKRQSTYHSFLEGEAEQRPNLTILTGYQVTRLLLEGPSRNPVATGVECRTKDGETKVLSARKEIILSAGAIGSPQILMLSGIGPRRELEAADIPCLHELPGVGKNLKDHLHCGLLFDAPGLGEKVSNIGISVGPDALRAPAGPLPADPADDIHLTGELAALKAEAERRLQEWHDTGQSLVSSSIYDAVAFFSTGLGDAHSNDAQIGFSATGYGRSAKDLFRIDMSRYFDDVKAGTSADNEHILLLANPVLQRSVGEIVLTDANPDTPPDIRMNYFSDPHDLKVMVAVMRRALEIVENWQGDPKPSAWIIPPFLAEKHRHVPGQPPSDALLENMALHFSTTVYHLCCTCRMGDVVDTELRVKGIGNLRVADASIFPDIISGNTNAACIMVGEKTAEIIAHRHGISLAKFVGNLS